MEDQNNAASADASGDASLSVEAAAERMMQAEAPVETTKEVTQGKSDDGRGEAAADPGYDESDLEASEGDANDHAQDDESDISLKGDATVNLRDGRKVTIGDLKKAFGELETVRAERDKFTATQQEVEAKTAQIAHQEKFLQRTYPAVLHFMRERVGNPPPISMLDPRSADYDEIGYQTQKSLYEARRDAFQQQVGLFQQRAAEEQRKHAVSHQEYIKGEHKQALEKLPELKTKEGAEKFYESFTTGLGKHYGFEKEDVDQVADHRLLLLAKDAIAWRDFQAKRMEKLRAIKAGNQPSAPVIAASRRVSGAERASEARQGLISRARQSGSLDDVAAAIDALG